MVQRASKKSEIAAAEKSRTPRLVNYECMCNKATMDEYDRPSFLQW
jgi:hypothetical protein